LKGLGAVTHWAKALKDSVSVINNRVVCALLAMDMGEFPSRPVAHCEAKDRLTVSWGQLLNIANEENSRRWLTSRPDQVPKIESAHASFIDYDNVPRQQVIFGVTWNESHCLFKLPIFGIDGLIELGVEPKHPVNRHDVGMPVSREIHLDLLSSTPGE